MRLEVKLAAGTVDRYDYEFEERPYAFLRTDYAPRESDGGRLIVTRITTASIHKDTPEDMLADMARLSVDHYGSVEVREYEPDEWTEYHIIADDTGA